MRANEIIRNVLDLIDQIECQKAQEPAQISIVGQMVSAPIAPEVPTEEPISQDLDQDDETRRFRQIVDILSTKDRNTMYSNSPNEMISGPASVTTDAGGGWNGPKNPADMRSDSVSLYPNHQHRPGA